MQGDSKKISEDASSKLHQEIGNLIEKSTESVEPWWALTDLLIDLFGLEAAEKAAKNLPEVLT